VEAIEAIEEQWDSGVKNTLLVLPTGLGKTIVFTNLAKNHVALGERVLILAHRGELLEQAADKLFKATGLQAAVEKAEESARKSWFRVTVGSVQTLMREKRLKQFEPDYYDVIIVDEAHHVLADSYQKVLDYFSGAKVLGVTATADRTDKKNLGQFFESLAYEYSLPEAIRNHYLSPMKALTIPLKIDISGVSMSAGDFKASEVGTALDPYLYQIADEMVKYCQNRKTVVFLPLVATSKKFRDILNEKGFRAAEVNGESKDRAEVLADFDAGKYNVICNSMLLTEGWDSPAVDCIIMLRPTKSRPLYVQCIGRGLRLSPGKEDCLILDFLWHTERHELVHPAHLIAPDNEVAAKMTEKMAIAEDEEPALFDLEEIKEEAESDVVADREKALAEKLTMMKKRKGKLVDPLQFEMSIQAEDLSGYQPSFGWEMAPASTAQLKALEKFGIFPDEIDNAGKAKLLLDKLNKRRESGMTTPKQIRFLEKRGFQHVGAWRFETARKLIDRIAGNGWRVPADIDVRNFGGNSNV
jgi:superfamily II DNA or RNA helicase